MWDSIVGYVLLFKDFIFVAVAACVLLTTAVWLATRRFSWRGRRRLIYGWFLNRTDRELLFVSAALLQFLFILSSVLLGTEMELAHLIFLAALALIKLVAGLVASVFVRDMVSSLLVFSALFVGNILAGYLRETRMNGFVAAVLVLLGIFLLLYGAYFLLKDISSTERDMGL